MINVEKIEKLISRAIGHAWNWTIIGFLLCKHRIKRKRLKLEKINFLHTVSLKGCKVTIAWQVEGCYKIAIQGARVVPGNRRHLSFTLIKAPDYLIITFYGIKEKEYRALHLQQGGVMLSSQFLVQPRTPRVAGTAIRKHCQLKAADLQFSVKLHPKQLEFQISQMIQGKREITTKLVKYTLANPKIKIYGPQIGLTPFNIDQYT